jgi:hypothetical protein
MERRTWSATSAVDQAKQRAGGRDRGAPPIAPPRFDQVAQGAPPTEGAGALPKEQEQRPTRPPEVIKKDMEEMAKVLQKQQDESGRADPVKSLEPSEATREPTLGDVKGPKFWDEYRSSLQKFDDSLRPDPKPEELDAEGDLWESDGDFRQGSIREAIESRLEPLQTHDIILYESVEQRHVIIPGTLEVMFRSLTTNEDMAIKELVYELVGSDRYVLDCLTVMTLTCGLKSFNGAELPTHLVEKDGDLVVDKEKFKTKYARVRALNLHTVALLSVVYMWFDKRIRSQIISSILGKSSRPRSDGPEPT